MLPAVAILVVGTFIAAWILDLRDERALGKATDDALQDTADGDIIQLPFGFIHSFHEEPFR
jgi:hypothetical protein